MRISEQWLRQMVDPEVDGAALAEQLTMAGLEVDKIEPAGPDDDRVVVGKVTALRTHPRAEKLQIADVDVGAGATLSIVCGAPNVAVGGVYPTATAGAVLPGGVVVEAAELRGERSQGMLCSARELGLGEDAGGLLTLPADAAPGRPLTQLLGLDDVVIEIDLTPNRGDCLGVEGVAREVSVLNRCAFAPLRVEPVAAVHDERVAVTLSAAAACPRFVSRVIRGVDARAATPLWLVERLRRAGVRSLGPLIDVTNYVMLELNHPMHAYDRNKLAGAIDVRYPRAGEQVALLNGQTVTPDVDTLLITDDSGPIGLAGIMGGATTECDDDTRDVLLECAFFSAERIAGHARRYGLHTDASHRFERGVDPHGQRRAVERATRLLIDMAGGEPGPLVDTVHQEQLASPRPIELRASRLALLLGIEVAAETVTDILTRLGMTVVADDRGWRVTPPSFRADVVMEADLIEEVGRVYGYKHLPIGRPAVRPRAPAMAERRLPAAALRDALLARGFQETISYSFIDAELAARFADDPQRDAPLALANPISADMAVMRTSLWPGLCKTVAYNRKRQLARVKIFECGLSFNGGAEALQQVPRIAGALSGAALPEQWGAPRRAADFFDIKADVEALLALGGDADRYRFAAAEHAALHPGQSARIERDGEAVGWVGALHPRLARELDLDAGVLLFELRADAIAEARLPQYAPLSKFPHSRRDLSLLVDAGLSADALRDSILELAGPLLRDAVLFDVYQGPGVDENQKSLTFGLILQDFSRNLTDQEVSELMTGVLAGLAQRHDASLRE